MSSRIASSSSLPHSYVLSRLLLIMHTNSWRLTGKVSWWRCPSVLLHLLQGSVPVLPEFVKRCNESYVNLNLTEMIIDFWLCNIEYNADAVHDMDAQIAQSYKYLRLSLWSSTKLRCEHKVHRETASTENIFVKVNVNVIRTFYVTSIVH